MFFLEDYSTIAGCPGDLPTIVGKLISLVYMVIRIGIPIILLIVGMVDLGKAVVAQKDDEIKKAQSLLIKKVIAAVLVFLLLTLIQFSIKLVDTSKNQETMWTCINVLLNFSDEGNKANYEDSKAKCSGSGGTWTANNNCDCSAINKVIDFDGTCK